MTGVFYILAFYAAGELLARLTGGWVSGGVIGMILLFAALCSGVLKPDKVRDISRMLLGNMAMFFIPLGVGIVAAYAKSVEHHHGRHGEHAAGYSRGGVYAAKTR
jgi:holin-like protein